jgi:aspartyl/asparaginyl beta-hydroxylase (cupin superfamily)
MTNGQLKFHLGLVIPMVGKGDERRPCAGGLPEEKGAALGRSQATGAPSPVEIRVGNETRAWRKKEVLFFDDSWEHEVWNRCRSERVVLQLVMAHPDLEAKALELPHHSKGDSERTRQALLGQVFGLTASH